MAAESKHAVEIEGRRLTLSNLEKPLYPSGFTKGQVIDFYIQVSDYMLPHVAGRPVTLKRYPDGVRAANFYEKNAPRHTPEWVETFAVPRRTGGPAIRYIVISDLPTLVWCANNASLEIHPFLSRAPDIQRPTPVVFDLDPGEGLNVLDCTKVAFLLQKKLGALGLEAFPKVSGSKGLQVYVPLNTPVTYSETQPFARGMAEALEREHPGEVISEMAKSVRKGKVFVDWSQNSDFKTTVSVYSIRAKRDEPFVSAPVSWEELRQAVKREKADELYFRPEDVQKRLKRGGDLFEPVLSLKQKLPGAAAHGAPGKSAEGARHG